MNTNGDTSQQSYHHTNSSQMQQARKSFPSKQELYHAEQNKYGGAAGSHQMNYGNNLGGSQTATLKYNKSDQQVMGLANVRVSTGGSSKLDTIKAFVEQANRNQMEQMLQGTTDADITACSIEQAEFQARKQGFKKPLQDVMMNNSSSGLININVPQGNYDGGTAHQQQHYGKLAQTAIDSRNSQTHSGAVGSNSINLHNR